MHKNTGSTFTSTAAQPIQNKTLSGHTNAVSSIVLLPSGAVVSGSIDKTLRVWDVESGECLEELNGHRDEVYALTVLPNGNLVSGSVDNTIRVWDVEKGECLKVLDRHTGRISALTVLPSGNLVSGSEDGTLRIWDVAKGRRLKSLKSHTGPVSALTVLPSGELVSGSSDNTLRVWDVAKGECLKVLDGHDDWVRALSVLPSGMLVSGSEDKTIRVWDVGKGECLKVLEGHTGSVTALTLLPSGNLVSGSKDNTLRVWDLAMGECLKVLEGHTNWLSAITVLPSGVLVSGSWDNTLRIWTETRDLELIFQRQLQAQAARESALLEKAQREAEQKFSNNLSELKQGYETGSLKPQAIIKRYAELLQEYQSNDAKKEIIIIARAEFNIFIASNATNQKQKELLLSGAKKDLEGILETNPYHEKALTLLENIEKLMQQSNSLIASADITAPSDSAPLPPSSQELAVPISDGSMKKTASFESSGMIELNLNIQYTELKFDKRLGQGAYGEVYSGTWRYNQVAIKKLLGTNYNEEAIRELQQEAQVLAKVRSDYVVQIKGLAIQSPHYCLVMELMPKGNLYELLQSEQPLGWTQRYQLAQDIGIGLHHLHAENILHRDLKSLNVLLTNDYRAKLCDFGLAKIKTTTKTQSRMTQTNAGAEKSVGTLPWMAPELFGLRPKYSTKSDVYAYGIIMWELSARRVPYEDVADETILINEVKQGAREEIPTETPIKFAELIGKCWAQRAEARPEVDEVLQTLEGFRNQLSK